MNEAGTTPDRTKQTLGDTLTNADTRLPSPEQNAARLGRRIRIAAILACVAFWGAVIYYALG